MLAKGKKVLSKKKKIYDKLCAVWLITTIYVHILEIKKKRIVESII